MKHFVHAQVRDEVIESDMEGDTSDEAVELVHA